MLRKVSVLISFLFVFTLFSCSNLFVNNSNDNETKLTINLPSAGIARAAENSQSYFYKITCTPELEGGTKLEKTGKSGEEITFTAIATGSYTITAEAFKTEKMELLLYKGESKAEVVAGKDTEVSIVLKYVGPKTEVPADGSENTIKVNFNENTGELTVETQTKDGVTVEKVYWLYKDEVIPEEELDYIEIPKMKLSAVAKFSDGSYSACTVEESQYNGSSGVSFSKQSSIKENTEAKEKGMFNYNIKLLVEGKPYYSTIAIIPVDSLLAGESEVVFESEIGNSLSHTYSGNLVSGWYYVLTSVKIEGEPTYFSQIIRIEKGFESNYGYTVVSGSNSGGDGEPEPATLESIYGTVQYFTPSEEVEKTSTSTNMATLTSAITGATDKTNETVLCIDGLCVAQTGATTINGKVRLISKTGATIYRCASGSGYSNPVFIVSEGATFTIGGEGSAEIIIDGNYNIGTSSPLIMVNASGTLVMDKNSVIQNNYNAQTTTNKEFGTIYLSSSTSGTAKFVMNDGKIQGCYSAKTGGAINSVGVSGYLAEIELNGGVISNNTSVSNGGAIALTLSTLVLNGTEISGNFMKAGSNGSGSTPQTGGGAIYMKSDTSKITLKSGAIKNNKSNCFGGALMIMAGTLEIPSDSTVSFADNKVVDVSGETETVVSTRGSCLAINSSSVNIKLGEITKNTSGFIYESYEEIVALFN